VDTRLAPDVEDVGKLIEGIRLDPSMPANGCSSVMIESSTAAIVIARQAVIRTWAAVFLCRRSN